MASDRVTGPTDGCARRAALMCALLAAAGCASSDPPAPRISITSITTSDVVALSPDDVVTIMRRAGFGDEEIVEVGADFRNALSSAGGARVRVDEKVEALFATDGPRLHISSRRTGSFILPLPATPAPPIPPARTPPAAAGAAAGPRTPVPALAPTSRPTRR